LSEPFRKPTYTPTTLSAYHVDASQEKGRETLTGAARPNPFGNEMWPRAVERKKQVKQGEVSGIKRRRNSDVPSEDDGDNDSGKHTFSKKRKRCQGRDDLDHW
jgi:hypothetical protein